MSSCRCADIERCKKNIQRLELAAEEIDHLATPYMDISDKLDSLVNTALLAYDSNNFDAFSNEAKGLKYDMRDAMDSCQAAIGDAIDKLQLDLADMSTAYIMNRERIDLIVQRFSLAASMVKQNAELSKEKEQEAKEAIMLC